MIMTVGAEKNDAGGSGWWNQTGDDGRVNQ